MRPVSSRQLRLLILACLWATWSGLNSRATIALEVDGIQVELENKASPATLAAKTMAPFKLELQVDPNSERRPLVVRIKLPVTGRGAWPAADVEVRDEAGRAVIVSRSGIEWHLLRIPLPPQHARYFVQTAEPLGGRSPRIAESRRQLTDTKSGLRIHLPQWFDHREAALSIRFDDSHPTHLSKAAPILDEYGFRGTFMVNPGSSEPGSRRRSSFADHRAGWEALARQDRHEFANHSAHHRGANGDADMEAEIGEAARTIWPLFPHRSRLLALNLGGGTLWSTSHTLRHYLDKYHLFDASSGSLGMDDSYGGRVDQLRRSLDQHIQRGLWCRIHYHYIGEGLSSSEANFRAAMEEIKSRAARLWIAGMADIHKYATERAATSLDPVDPGGNEFAFRLNCATDPTLYDQALTVEMTPPEAWSPHRITVRSDSGERIALRTAKVGDRTVLRFEAAARNETYRIGLQ
jgi:hypothetical protein